MKKRMIALLLLVALLLPVLAACGEDSAFITPEKAQKIALKAMGYRASQVEEIHTHGGQYEGKPAYSVHITVGGVSYECVILASNGEVISTGLVEE